MVCSAQPTCKGHAAQRSSAGDACKGHGALVGRGLGTIPPAVNAFKIKRFGPRGLVEFEEVSAVLFGRVIGLRDVITFQGESVAEVTQAFHDSVDDYLEFCAERGESPEKPYSGQFVLRLNPQLHRELANLAQVRSMSLNALIESILEKNIGHGAEQGSPSAAKASPTRTSPAKRTRQAPVPIGRASVDPEQLQQLKAEENRFIQKQTRAIVEALQALGVSKSIWGHLWRERTIGLKMRGSARPKACDRPRHLDKGVTPFYCWIYISISINICDIEW